MGFLHRARKDDVDVESCLANLSRLEAVAAADATRPVLRADLDAMAHDAATSLVAPMGFVSILDALHIHLAGSFGAQGELAETRMDSAENSYCKYVVAHNDVLVINDSTTDALVRTHPATADGIRAYLGVPIRVGDQCIGSFCVVDVAPRSWTDEDLEALAEMAAAATTHIGNGVTT